MPWRRLLRRKREAAERQVPAGCDDEAVILDVEPVNGVSLDAGGPDAGACDEVQKAELVGLRDEEADGRGDGEDAGGEGEGRCLGELRGARGDAEELPGGREDMESVCSTGARDASAMVVQLRGSVSAGPVGRQRSAS